MNKNNSLDSDIESLVYQLSHSSSGIGLAFETIGVIEREKDDAYAQLYRYAADLQQLLSRRDSVNELKADKDAAYQQLDKFGVDFQKLLKEREAAYDALARSHLETLQRLVIAAEYKDDDTGVHIVRMSHFSSIIARSYGQDDNYCTLILQASPMHDIGKIGIPDRILKKSGKLLDDEWIQMRRHPEYGASILAGSEVPVIQMASEIALHHHEKFDGSGYPHNIKGKNIPKIARIFTIVDVFDALTSKRPYKEAFSYEDSINIIKNERGSHFDSDLVDIFIQISKELYDSTSSKPIEQLKKELDELIKKYFFD